MQINFEACTWVLWSNVPTSYTRISYPAAVSRLQSRLLFYFFVSLRFLSSACVRSGTVAQWLAPSPHRIHSVQPAPSCFFETRSSHCWNFISSTSIEVDCFLQLVVSPSAGHSTEDRFLAQNNHFYIQSMVCMCFCVVGVAYLAPVHTSSISAQTPRLSAPPPPRHQTLVSLLSGIYFLSCSVLS